MENCPDHMSTISVSSFTRRRRRPSGKFLRLSKNSVTNELIETPPSLKQFTFHSQRKFLKPQKSSLSTRDNGSSKVRNSVTFTLPVTQDDDKGNSSSGKITTSLLSAREILDNESEISKLETLCFEPPHISPREQNQDNETRKLPQNGLDYVSCHTAGSDFAIDTLFSDDNDEKGEKSCMFANVENNATELQEEIKAIDETIRELKRKRKELVKKQRADFWRDLFEGTLFLRKTSQQSK